MRKITLILMMFFSCHVYAQRYADIGLNLNSPANQDTVTIGVDMISIKAVYKNNGPDTVLATDSLAMQIILDDTIILYFGSQLKPYMLLPAYHINPGDSANWLFSVGIGNWPTPGGEVKFCIKVISLNIVDTLHDTTMANNIDCRTLHLDREGASVPQSVPNLQEIELYPNPVSGKANFNVHLKEAAMLDLNIVDVAGRVVLQHKQQMRSGTQIIILNTGELSPGMYSYSISSGEERFNGKMQIQ